MKRPKSALSLFCLAAAAALGALLAGPAPAAADWLVTRDGARIETKGKWRVEGAKVVFDLPNGTMGVLRKTEVDLDASAAASAAKSPAPATPAGERAPGQLRDPRAPREGKKPVLVVTDKDIRKKGPAIDEPDPAQVSTQSASSTAGNNGSPVVVESWRQALGDNGEIEIFGVLKNVGADVAGNITVEVQAVGDDGKVRTAAGFLEKSSLVRDKQTSFRAIFPDLSQLSKPPTFTVTADGASVGVTAADQKAAGQGEAKKPQ